MAYTVKEIFYTLQGEGAQAGRPAVFCRFSGCNLWTGREADRATATCRFCDTDFLGIGPDGGRFDTATALAEAVRARWPGEGGRGTDARADARAEARADARARNGEKRGATPLVVCTGGEPLLQLDAEAVAALHAAGFEVAVETNGTQPPPAGIDWLCVSPKAGAPLAVSGGDELKLVFPQAGAEPERFEHLAFGRFSLQPMEDGERTAANTRDAVAYCLAHPRWRLSLQAHKMLGLR